MYKHIIWDFDGTLFDTYPVMAKAAIDVLEKHGIYESYDKIMSLMRISFTNLFDYFNETYYISDKLISDFLDYKKEAEADTIRPFPYITDICKRIWEDKRFNHLYTHRGKSSIEYLKKHGMYDYFSGLITREDNFKRKPDPEALLWLLVEYKIDKSEALMIGDRDIDILAAKNAGIDGCYYKDYPLHDFNLAKYKITELNQLYDLLKLK